MQIRRSRLLTAFAVLPLLCSTLALQVDTSDIKDTARTVKKAAAKALPDFDDVAAVASSVLGVPTRVPIGTKDAPVDGLDGKPHAGPFVDSSSTSEKAKAAVKDTTTSIKSKVKNTETEKGVMNDANRQAPRKGTTGTEGGVSEKERLAEAGGLKRPEAPKEAPKLPAGDSARLGLESAGDTLKSAMGDDNAATMDKPRGAAGIEKPSDLPEKLRDITQSGKETASQLKDSIVDTSKSLKSTAKTASTRLTGLADEAGKHDLIPWDSLMGSFSSIAASEIGDKTFIVAALMAMRYPRFQVFTAAASALLIMTILSAVAGHALGAIISKRWAAVVAALLFLGFGAKSLKEGMDMDSNAGVGEEMREVEAELEEKEMDIARAGGQRSAYSLEAGRKGRESPSPSRSPSRRSLTSAGGIKNLLSLLLSPAWVETFSMTFIGELGDRSQIATVAMAAGQEFFWVMVGACLGHLMCTAFAVLGGSLMAGRISMKKVTLAGGGIFVLFGIFTAYEAILYFA